MKRQIRIAIAEDHLMFRQGIIKMLEEYEDINVVFHVGNGKELLDGLKKHRIDIVLLDIEMPIMPGRVVLEKLKIKHEQVKVIIVSQHFQDAYILEYVKLGASSFLAKNADIERIVDAIYAVYDTGYYFDVKVAGLMAGKLSATESDTVPLNPIGTYITERELEVLKKLVEAKTARQIADELNISPKTVENHKASLLKKTKCNNTVALISYAQSNALI